MTMQVELNEIFDVVEELVGTYPSADALRSAIHAIISKSIDFEFGRLGKDRVGSYMIMDNVEYLARNYETLRGSHMHLNVTSYSNSREPDVFDNGLCTAECNRP